MEFSGKEKGGGRLFSQGKYWKRRKFQGRLWLQTVNSSENVLQKNTRGLGKTEEEIAGSIQIEGFLTSFCGSAKIFGYPKITKEFWGKELHTKSLEFKGFFSLESQEFLRKKTGLAATSAISEVGSAKLFFVSKSFSFFGPFFTHSLSSSFFISTNVWSESCFFCVIATVDFCHFEQDANPKIQLGLPDCVIQTKLWQGFTSTSALYATLKNVQLNLNLFSNEYGNPSIFFQKIHVPSKFPEGHG